MNFLFNLSGTTIECFPSIDHRHSHFRSLAKFSEKVHHFHIGEGFIL